VRPSFGISARTRAGWRAARSSVHDVRERIGCDGRVAQRGVVQADHVAPHLAPRPTRARLCACLKSPAPARPPPATHGSRLAWVAGRGAGRCRTCNAPLWRVAKQTLSTERGAAAAPRSGRRHRPATAHLAAGEPRRGRRQAGKPSAPAHRAPGRPGGQRWHQQGGGQRGVARIARDASPSHGRPGNPCGDRSCHTLTASTDDARGTAPIRRCWTAAHRDRARAQVSAASPRPGWRHARGVARAVDDQHASMAPTARSSAAFSTARGQPSLTASHAAVRCCPASAASIAATALGAPPKQPTASLSPSSV